MSLNDLAKAAHRTAKEHGFWEFGAFTEQYAIAVKLALIHSEVSEALEADRQSNGGLLELGEELADIIIRVLDLVGYLGIDLDTILAAKMATNEQRPYQHNKRY